MLDDGGRFLDPMVEAEARGSVIRDKEGNWIWALGEEPGTDFTLNMECTECNWADGDGHASECSKHPANVKRRMVEADERRAKTRYNSPLKGMLS